MAGDVEMAGDSPLGDDVQQTPESGNQPKRPLFRDKLMGGVAAPPPKKFVDLVDSGHMKVSYVNDNPLLLRLNTERTVLDGMCAPWKESLVVGLLGKHLGYRTMKAKLENLWRLSGGFDIMDMDNSFYIVKFDISGQDKSDVGWTMDDLRSLFGCINLELRVHFSGGTSEENPVM